MKPTAEQVQAVDLFLSGESFKVLALAGTGKTTVLQMMAEADPFQRGRLVAFNKNIITEAQNRMPSQLKCQTAHSLAYGGTSAPFRDRLSRTKRMSSRDVAARLDINTPLRYSYRAQDKVHTKSLEPWFLAGRVMAAIERFCQSADPAPAERHFSYVDGIDAPDGDINNRHLRGELLSAAVAAWQDLCRPDGALPYKHAYYLKQYELRGPRLRCDYVMVDEAQDLSPVLMSIVEQQADNCQLIFVGDSYQAINQFTGAVDALRETRVARTTYLTKSWRFGSAIADEANKILARLGANLRVEGNAAVDSRVGRVVDPTCILSRTNAGAVRQVLSEMDAGGRPHLIGGGQQVVSFAQAALDLQDGRRTSHGDLACFSNWEEVQTYAEHDEQGAELQLLVRLIDEFKADRIIAALERMPDETAATRVCSTAHKVKGREWDTVTLDSDFGGATGNLLYVAVTRGRHAIDISDVEALSGKSPDRKSDAEGARSDRLAGFRA